MNRKNSDLALSGCTALRSINFARSRKWAALHRGLLRIRVLRLYTIAEGAKFVQAGVVAAAKRATAAKGSAERSIFHPAK